MGKLSIYSSESVVSIESPGYEGRKSVNIFVEELEIINNMIRCALEFKGKVVESVGNAQEDLKILVKVVCDEVVGDGKIGENREKWEKEVVELGKFTQGLENWKKIWVNSGTGCYLTGQECKETCAVVVGLMREYGREAAEERIRVLEGKLFDAKLCIKQLRDVIKAKNKEISTLTEDFQRAECILANRDLNAARYLDSETTNYEDY